MINSIASTQDSGSHPGLDNFDVQVWHEPHEYTSAIALMEQRVNALIAPAQGVALPARELLWLLEHQPVYTCGTSAKASDFISTPRFPVVKSGRGGQITFHAPGQRIAYLVVKLSRYNNDLRRYVTLLEQWIIDSLADFGIDGIRRPEHAGVWVEDFAQPSGLSKIAAIGVRVRRWVAFHGISINAQLDVSPFGDIVPCGISDAGITTIATQLAHASGASGGVGLGFEKQPERTDGSSLPFERANGNTRLAIMKQLDAALLANFEANFVRQPLHT